MLPNGGSIAIEIPTVDDSMQPNKAGSSSVEMIEIHDCSPNLQSEYCIQRVNNRLRLVNVSAYEPQIIAIGPYHRCDENLKWMEQYKIDYLKSLAQRGRKSENEFFEVVRPLEDQVRKHYAELPEFTSDEFVRMLVLDGCFIIELLSRYDEMKNDKLTDENDPIFRKEWILNNLKRDLLLFENQIPFFVLFKLFNMIEVAEQNKNFILLAMRFFRDLLPGKGCPAIDGEERQGETIHLLGLVHDNWLPSFSGEPVENQKNWKMIPHAAELRKAGVKFEIADGTTDLLIIKFEHGTIQIPHLVVEARTECFFRNLIAYEQHYQNPGHRFIISYAKFLNCLIKSPEDVEILRGRGIISNMFTDEAVSQIFNTIIDTVTDPGSHFHYIDVFNEVNGHYNSRCNRWMVKLRREYCHSPWAVISVLAASLLLIMTLIQTIFSVLSYNQKSN